MKTEGIPLWITIVLGLIVILSLVAGGMALFGHGMDDFMGPSWGGRNLGLGLATLTAIVLKNATAYMAVLFASIARELGDIVELSRGDAPDWPVVIFALVLLVIWCFGLLKANQARKQTGT